MTEVQFAKQFLTTLDSKPTKYQPDHIFDQQNSQNRTPYALPKLSHPPHPLPSRIEQQSTTTTSTTEQTATAPASGTSLLDVTLKSGRNPTFTLNLPSLPSSTPITTLKTQIQSLLSSTSNSTTVPQEKIKILYNKKPLAGSKSTLNDVLADITTAEEKNELEFGVMVMGGAPDPTPTIQTITLAGEVESTSTPSTQTTKQTTATTTSLTEPTNTDARTDPNITKSPEPVQPGEISGKEVLQTQEFWEDLQGFLEQRLRSSQVAQEVRTIFEKAVR